MGPFKSEQDGSKCLTEGAEFNNTGENNQMLVSGLPITSPTARFATIEEAGRQPEEAKNLLNAH